MATKKEIKEHLKIALKEIGKIDPWFDKDVNSWVFEHPDYPVGCGGDSREEVIKKYPLYLEEFIRERLNDNVTPSVEKEQKGKVENGKEPDGPRIQIKNRNPGLCTCGCR